MIFLLLFVLIIFSQVIFTQSFFSDTSIILQTIGWIQLIVFLFSFVFLIYFFSQRKHNDFKKGFSAFGAFILFGVPGMMYLVPGLLFHVTGNESLKVVGWTLSALLFLGILVGVFYGRWNWKTHRIQLSFPHFPEELNTLKIVQISDIHVGSFFNNHAARHRAKVVRNLTPCYSVTSPSHHIKELRLLAECP